MSAIGPDHAKNPIVGTPDGRVSRGEVSAYRALIKLHLENNPVSSDQLFAPNGKIKGPRETLEKVRAKLLRLADIHDNKNVRRNASALAEDITRAINDMKPGKRPPIIIDTDFGWSLPGTTPSAQDPVKAPSARPHADNIPGVKVNVFPLRNAGEFTHPTLEGAPPDATVQWIVWSEQQTGVDVTNDGAFVNIKYGDSKNPAVQFMTPGYYTLYAIYTRPGSEPITIRSGTIRVR